MQIDFLIPINNTSAAAPDFRSVYSTPAGGVETTGVGATKKASITLRRLPENLSMGYLVCFLSITVKHIKCDRREDRRIF